MTKSVNKVLFPSLLLIFIFCAALPALALPAVLALPAAQETSMRIEPDYYELRIYHLKNEDQEKRMDHFLESAFLPAMDRAGIGQVGVFKPIAEDSTFGKRIFVYIPFRSPAQLLSLNELLNKDELYQKAGTDYLDAPHDNPPYVRIETILMKAFKDMPQFQSVKLQNPSSERIYELRSYEAATEKLYQKKVHMFNEGKEIEIFQRLGFNPIFFGEVISGSHMPNLMYMTAHANKEAHKKNWKAFQEDPQWKKLSPLKEYEHTVSHADIYLLKPTAYSGI